MNNFEFFNPVKVVFGKGQIEALSKLIPTDKKVLLTYGGGSIKKNGVYEQAQKALSNHTVVEFGGIQPNPQYDTLMEAVEVARTEKVDFVLAIGGGSVVDGSKFIASAIHHNDEPWKILSERQAIQNIIPIGCVLTLPATGSEMNSFSVVSRGKDKLSFGGDPRLFPQFSILDPEITYSLPERQLGNGIVDAFVHVLEQYLTKNINTAIQDRFAEGILLTLIEEAPKVIQLKDDYDSRANFMWAATQALNGLIGSGVVHDWSTHMIGHELTALHGIDHARSLAVVLPSLLRSQKENKRQKLLQFAQRVWDIKGTTPEERIELAISKTEDFFNSVGVPTKLKVYSIEEKDIDTIVESLRSHIPSNLGENQNIDAAMVKDILLQAL
ncbi:MAG: NADP-dependent alcohol dehydrogenase [Bacteriovoracaceae bacterium]|jgi:NADP-dependent alcohol dehydrogenase